MTALKKFEKLETSALWRENGTSQRRDVFASFGDVSLIISDANGIVLAHWSLPAIERLNPAQRPAVFTLAPDSDETLEIDDDLMIGAIEEIRAAVLRRRPRPGRLRLVVFLVLMLGIVLLAIFWLPGALERHATRVVPVEVRADLGRRILGKITTLTGKPCQTEPGNRALTLLAGRLGVGARRGRILILPGGVIKSAHLPGGIILLNRRLVEDYESPDVAAGHVLIEDLRAAQTDPLAALLQAAGTLQSFRLLTTGKLDPSSLEVYAPEILTREIPMPDDALIIARFRRARVATSPLAYALDITGETTLPLIEGDPFANIPAPRLIPDQDWISLQAICGN